MTGFGINLKFKYDLESFISIVDEFSENTNYGYSVDEENGEIVVNIELLPYMPLKFKVTDEAVSMDVNTCYFGMGYHVLVVEFIDEFMEYLDCNFVVNDNTNYFNIRNANVLEEKFDNWLTERVNLIKENQEDNLIKSNLMHNEDLIPITDEDYICCYTGLVPSKEFFELFEIGISELKKRVFVFPELVEDGYATEGYLLYHIWNNLKDLTLVDDFDERVSLTMFMFENLIEKNEKIHLPQKFAREIYKYLGVDGFSASNFVYRKVKYEIGYHLYDKILLKYDFKFVVPGEFLYNKDTNTYDSPDNSIFISEYISGEDLEFNSEISESIDKDDFRVDVFKTENKNSIFLGYEKGDDEYNYIPLGIQNKSQPENTSLKLVFNGKIYEILVYGRDSLEIIKKIIGVM